MYDFAEVGAATNAFWGAIAERLRQAGVDGIPTHLSRAPDYASAWWDPRLILGQICGYPLFSNPENFNNAANRPRIVATPVYSAPGCKGPRHSSFFIVNAKSNYARLADLRGRTCAINGFDSNTGINLLRAAVAPLSEAGGFFGSVIVTGSHAQSAEAVARKDADLASIDCVTFAHLRRLNPDLTARVRQIGQSALAPAPPFITASTADGDILRILRNALDGVAADPELSSVNAALLIDGFEMVSTADYELSLRTTREAAANLLSDPGLIEGFVTFPAGAGRRLNG